MIDHALLEILRCPVCQARVALDGTRVACGQCGRRYPVRDGIPVMLPEAADTAA